MEFCIWALLCTRNDWNFSTAYSWNASRLTVLLSQFKSPSLRESLPLLCKMLVLSPGSSERSRCVSGMSLRLPCHPLPPACLMAERVALVRREISKCWLLQVTTLVVCQQRDVPGQTLPAVAKGVLGPARMCLHARPEWLEDAGGSAGWFKPTSTGGCGIQPAQPCSSGSWSLAIPERPKDHSCAWCQVCRNSISANVFAVWLCNGKCFRK